MRCHSTAVIMWHCVPDICVLSDHSNKEPKPSTTRLLYRWYSKRHILMAIHILHYSVCANKALFSSCHHTALQCVWQQGSLQFLSPYCITVCVPTRLSSVPVTILPDWPTEVLWLSMLRKITTVLGAALWGVPSYVFRMQPISDSVW